MFVEFPALLPGLFFRGWFIGSQVFGFHELQDYETVYFIYAIFEEGFEGLADGFFTPDDFAAGADGAVMFADGVAVGGPAEGHHVANRGDDYAEAMLSVING